MQKLNHEYYYVRKNAMKENWKKVKKFASKNVHDYCENTSIHGLKYITNKSLHQIERLFFALSLVCVVLGSVYFVTEIYKKWNYTPMIVSINHKSTYITDEPFPAVTICNLNQASREKVEKFSNYSFEYAIIQMMCHREVNSTIADAISDWSNMINFILEQSQSCSDMLLKCKYAGENFNCTEMFNSIITDNGHCCTFNMVHPKFLYRSTIGKSFLKTDYNHPKGYVPVDWSPDKGYRNDLPEKFIPMKGAGSGESLGMELVLDVESDNYYCSSSDGVGFKILLHNPLEMPHMREIGLLLEPGKETKISIRAEKIESDEYVREIKQSARKCFFEDEKPLKLYNSYTEHNCVTECSAGKIKSECHCIPFFKPMLYDNDSICSFYDTSCVERVRLETMIINSSRNNCALCCQASCNDLMYTAALFSAPLVDFDMRKTIKISKNISDEYWKKNVAIVNIYFMDNAYRSEKNWNFVGSTDFLSNIGGIVGLFFGFSFVSLAELIFYAILRPLGMLFTKQSSRLLRSTKHRKTNAMRLLYGAKRETFKTNSFQYQNFALTNAACKHSTRKIIILGRGMQNAKHSWRPGMDYTP